MAGGTFGGGNGTSATPYLITDAADLNAVRNGLTLFYKLANNIDLNVAPYNTGVGWNPIGTSSGTSAFTGSIDGAGFTISNLFINSTVGHVGLFGYLGDNAVTKNLIFANVNVTTTNSWAGILAAEVAISTATNYVDITNCKVTSGTINFADTGGGLVGIKNNYGGLRIDQCSVTATVKGKTDNTGYWAPAGGLVGYFRFAGTDRLTNSNYTGDVSCRYAVGGLFGLLVTSAVEAISPSISNCWSKGTVTAGDIPNTNGTGGFAGYIQLDTGAVLTVDSCYSTSSVTTPTTTATIPIGGFAGFIQGGGSGTDKLIVNKCYASGDVSVPNAPTAYAGGFIGYATLYKDVISQCSSFGSVTIGNAGYAGGFIGWESNRGPASSASIQDCYSKSPVHAAKANYAGGFRGYEDNSYATTIRCYCANTVDVGATNRGGFAGNNTGTITNCFYDSTVSGLSDTGKGIPKTTTELKTKATYTTFDFVGIWQMTEGTTYAFFLWQTNDTGAPTIPTDANGFPTTPPSGATIWVMAVKTIGGVTQMKCYVMPSTSAPTFTRDQLAVYYPELHDNTNRDIYDWIQLGSSLVFNTWSLTSGNWVQDAGTTTDTKTIVDRNKAYKTQTATTAALVLPTINQDDPNTFPTPPADAAGNIWGVFSEDIPIANNFLYVVKILGQTTTTPFIFKRFIYDNQRDAINFTDPAAYYDVWRFKYEVATGLYRSLYYNAQGSTQLKSKGGTVIDPKDYREIVRGGKGFKTFVGITAAVVSNDIPPTPTKDYSSNPGAGLGTFNDLYTYSAKLGKWLKFSVSQ